jgi:hypothetical protein
MLNIIENVQNQIHYHYKHRKKIKNVHLILIILVQVVIEVIYHQVKELIVQIVIVEKL